MPGLYPPAVRQRWGAEIGREVAESGIRAWPNTMAGAGRLWLHPGDWPQMYPGQTRRVVAVALFVVAACVGLLLRASDTANHLTTDVRQPLTSFWIVPIVLGLGLAVPLPPWRWRALRTLAGQAIRGLIAPTVAFLALFLIARSGRAEHPAGLARGGLVAYYWTTLGFIAFSLCRLVARAAMLAHLPSARRLRASVGLTGIGLALAAGQSLLAMVRTGPRAGSLAMVLILIVVAAGTIRAGRDLRGATV
jgi:hypothetical protein